MKITIYMSLLGADRLWKFKQDMPLDNDGIEPIPYEIVKNLYSHAITIDYAWFKELKIMGLLGYA